MFPDVNRSSFMALKRFCYDKNFARTKTFIEKMWDKEALNEMMKITSTPDIDHLTNWLINPDLDVKLSTISNYYI